MQNPFEFLDKRLTNIEDLLLSIKHGKDSLSDDNQKDILRIEDAMKLTGLAKQTIYQMASSGRIPHVKKGRRLYFNRNELNEWLMSGAKRGR